MRTPLTTKRYSHEYLDKRLRTCIRHYLLATQPPFEDPPETFTAWVEALAWDAYTPEQQAALRTITWATLPCVASKDTTATFVDVTLSIDGRGATNLPICIPVQRDALMLPLASSPTETVRQIYGTTAYVNAKPFEATLGEAIERYLQEIPELSAADALRPACFATYPWESRLSLATRLTDACRVLSDYMHLPTALQLSLRQILTLCPELRPTATALREHRWTRTAAVREYAHVTAVQRHAWTEAINAYLSEDGRFQNLDDLRATLIPVMAHAQMSGGHQ